MMNLFRHAKVRLSNPLLLVLVGVLIVAASLTAMVTATTTTPSLQVQTNSRIDNGGSAQIRVQLRDGNPGSSYAVTVQVAPPTPSATSGEAGGPFCLTVTILTDGDGNGQQTVTYPDTGHPAAEFEASACAPAGVGGPSTLLAGTYTVTVSSPGATSPAPAIFTVSPSQRVVTGMGTFGGSAVKIYTAISASYTCTGSDVGTVKGCTSVGVTVPGYLTCNGTSPLPSTGLPEANTLQASYPSTATSYGTQTSTGIISTNTPGQSEITSLYNPCATSIPGAIEPVSYETMILHNVTIALPSGGTISGGLIIAGPLDSILQGAGTNTTTSSNWYTLRVEGTDGLAGVTGTCVSESATQFTSGVRISNNQIYWVQLIFPNYDN